MIEGVHRVEYQSIYHHQKPSLTVTLREYSRLVCGLTGKEWEDHIVILNGETKSILRDEFGFDSSPRPDGTVFRVKESDCHEERHGSGDGFHSWLNRDIGMKMHAMI